MYCQTHDGLKVHPNVNRRFEKKNQPLGKSHIFEQKFSLGFLTIFQFPSIASQNKNAF